MTTQQPNLFGPPNVYGAFESAPIRAHRADPVTSHEAAARVSKSGRRQRSREIALALVTASPGNTGHELFALATDEHQRLLGDYVELYRVLGDLKNRGLVVQGEPRSCRIRGTRMVTWLPAPTQ